MKTHKARPCLCLLIAVAHHLNACTLNGADKECLAEPDFGMDETYIKAGRQEKGKLHQGYFWPLYGDLDEIVFVYNTSRCHSFVPDILGDFKGTLLSDGYAAYERYAQCWSHSRRYEAASKDEPQASKEALALIGALYVHEDKIKTRKLTANKKLTYRTKHSEAIVKSFWRWCEQQCQRRNLLPKSPTASIH